ncbi:hypothetical protein WA588_002166, partial [Blastocystis sp. NMH]
MHVWNRVLLIVVSIAFSLLCHKFFSVLSIHFQEWNGEEHWIVPMLEWNETHMCDSHSLDEKERVMVNGTSFLVPSKVDSYMSPSIGVDVKPDLFISTYVWNSSAVTEVVSKVNDTSNALDE